MIHRALFYVKITGGGGGGGGGGGKGGGGGGFSIDILSLI